MRMSDGNKNDSNSSVNDKSSIIMYAIFIYRQSGVTARYYKVVRNSLAGMPLLPEGIFPTFRPGMFDSRL